MLLPRKGVGSLTPTVFACVLTCVHTRINECVFGYMGVCEYTCASMKTLAQVIGLTLGNHLLIIWPHFFPVVLLASMDVVLQLVWIRKRQITLNDQILLAFLTCLSRPGSPFFLPERTLPVQPSSHTAVTPFLCEASLRHPRPNSYLFLPTTRYFSEMTSSHRLGFKFQFHLLKPMWLWSICLNLTASIYSASQWEWYNFLLGG